MKADCFHKCILQFPFHQSIAPRQSILLFGYFCKKFPLTGNPLREINIYAVKTPERSLIVDTGFNNAELKRYMKKFIQDLDLDLSKTVLFLTHCHSDHVGLANFLDQQGIGEIIISKVDGELVEDGRTRFGEVWQHLIRDAHKQGMEPDELAIEKHPGYANRPTYSDRKSVV